MTPPSIHPWKLWVRNFDITGQATPFPYLYQSMPTMPMPFIPSGPVPFIPAYVPSRSNSMRSTMTGRPRRRSITPPPQMRHLQVTTSDKNGVMATFRVPGRVSLPSDMRQHNITIAQLNLDAEFSWYTIPSHDARVYIKVSVFRDSLRCTTARRADTPNLSPGQSKKYVRVPLYTRSDEDLC
jgi:hypothetical protein